MGGEGVPLRFPHRSRNKSSRPRQGGPFIRLRKGAAFTGHDNGDGQRTIFKVRALDGKFLKIGGRVYDLEDPEQRKAAVRAWLRAKAESRRAAHSEGKDDGESVVTEQHLQHDHLEDQILFRGDI